MLLGLGPALDDGGGRGAIVVLEGVEPLPPILVLVVVSVEAASVFVVCNDETDDVIVRMDPELALAAAASDVAEEAPEIAEEALETAEEAAELASSLAELAADDATATADVAI